MHRLSFAVIRVRTKSGCPTQGWLAAGPFRFPVALGRSGVRANKREGDGATPRGSFRPVRVWWRADRGLRPATRLPVRRIGRQDAWCEDPADRRYNRPIRLSDGTAGDRLWREDGLYDLIIEIDHNRTPRTARLGSAVFLHVARAGLAPTAGCIALPAPALRRLLRHLGPRSVVRVQ